MGGVAVPDGGVQQVHDYARDLFRRAVGVGLDPVVRAGLSAQDGVTRPGRQPGPLGQRQYGGGHYALFDPHEYDHGQGDHREGELDHVEAEDGAQHVQVEKLRSHEHEHRSQSRFRQVLEHAGGHGQDHDDGNDGGQAGDLGPTAGRSDDGRPRRAGIYGERASQAGQ